MAKKRNRYEVDGERVAGVTTHTGILDKPALIPWAAKMASEYLKTRWEPGKPYKQEEIDLLLEDAKNAHRIRKEKAGDIGSNIHELVESYTLGQLKPEQVKDEDERIALENYIIVTNGWEWHGAEIILLNKELMYGGTADGIATLPSGMVILADTKTSAGVYPEFDLQLAMYALAEPVDEGLREKWKEIEEARILHFNKERLTWEVLERDIKSQYEYIPPLCKMYQWKRKYASAW
jgi:hypothetical protein